MKVLYVEDDDISRDYLQQGLARHGLVVDVAKNGTVGLEHAKSGVYDVIVLDVMLPDFDGFELLRRLRSSGIDTPTIFLSARGEVSDRIQGLDLGADAFAAAWVFLPGSSWDGIRVYPEPRGQRHSLGRSNPREWTRAPGSDPDRGSSGDCR